MLVLGTAQRAAQATAWSLRRGGFRVVGAWGGGRLAGRTRYCERLVRIRARSREKKFVRGVRGLRTRKRAGDRSPLRRAPAGMLTLPEARGDAVVVGPSLEVFSGSPTRSDCSRLRPPPGASPRNDGGRRRGGRRSSAAASGLREGCDERLCRTACGATDSGHRARRVRAGRASLDRSRRHRARSGGDRRPALEVPLRAGREGADPAVRPSARRSPLPGTGRRYSTPALCRLRRGRQPTAARRVRISRSGLHRVDRARRRVVCSR